MSLIDEALKRARMEAAQKAAQGEGLPYPTIPRHLAPRRRAGWLVPLLIALAVIAGVIVGVLLASRGGSPASQTAELGLGTAAAAPSSIPPGSGPEQAENDTTSPPNHEPDANGPNPAAPGTGPTNANSVDPAESPGATGPQPAGDRPATAPATAPATSPPSPSPPAVDPAPVAQPPTAAPPTPPANTSRPTSSGATTVTDPDSGVLLVLPERQAQAAADSATPPSSGASAETYTQQYPLPGGGAIELGGIAWSETGPFALINGRVVGPGSVIENYTLENIRPGHVVLTGDGRRIQLSLQ